MTTMRPRPEPDAETGMIPAVTSMPPGADPLGETQVIPAIPADFGATTRMSAPPDLGATARISTPANDDTAVIPRIPPASSPTQDPRQAPREPQGPPERRGRVGGPATMAPAVAPARTAPPRPVQPGGPPMGQPLVAQSPLSTLNDSTAVIPVIRPLDEPLDDGLPPAIISDDDDGWDGRVRPPAYDSQPGPPEYRGKHSDIIPLTEGSPIRATIRTIGEIMITLGLVLLLFAGYEIWGKAAIVSSHQADLDDQLAQQWAGDDPTVADPSPDASAGPSAQPAGPPPPPPGGSLGRLYLPRLDKYWVVVEGVGDRDLAYAPGHYPDTAQPGEIGNFSVAGHRSPAIFWDLDRMRAGDAVVMETRNTFYIYRVTSSEIVVPTEVKVVAPVPDQPGVSPTEAFLTITTCNPKWDNYERLIVHAKLQRTQARTDGRPKELEE